MQYAGLGLGVAIALCVATAAAAEPARGPYSVGYEACVRRAGGLTISTQTCVEEEASRQDSILSGVYQMLAGRLEDPDRKQAFQVAQRAWMSYRKAECRYRAAAQAETNIATLTLDRCWLDMTADRIAVVQAQLRAEP